ncbi:hypothetical protein ACQP2F_27985 [Actinoplanes sp. CA-030573]|uniref:hypothetical protein n=1 Tax=Actinoplanes sp. CA-030573 TaxID=3239898 RepID=UPI003D94A5B7
MAQLDPDPLIAAFDEFRGRATSLVTPVGAGRTRERLRARRRHRIGAIGVLVVAIPLLVTGLLAGERHGRPAVPPAVSPSANYYVGPGETTHPSTQAPPGGITEAALYDAVLDLPAWPAALGACASGPVRFEGGDTVANDLNLWIAGVAYADVDRDGRAETFARVFCTGGERPDDVGSQVVAFTRGPGGGVRTIGPVLRQGGDAVAICGVRSGPGGTVQVQIADFPVPWRCADPTLGDERYITRQWLTFAWDGSAFAQRGTTARTTNPYATDLAATGGDLVLVRQANGHYRGSKTVTVHNTGASAIPYRTQTLLAGGMRLVEPPPGCAVDPARTGGGMEVVVCTAAKLAGGATRTVTLEVDAPRRDRIAFDPATDVIPLDGYNDPNQPNDRAAFTIEFRD